MISRTLVAISALSCAFSMAIGCGGSETTELPPSPFATEQGFCTKLAEAQCSKAVVQNCYSSSAETLEEDTLNCRQQAAQPSVCNPNGHSYRQSGAEACIAAWKTAYTDGKLELDELDDAYEACLAVYSGGRGVGQECVADHDCAAHEGLRCVVKVGAEATCQVPEEVGSGDSCSPAGAVCEEGYYCNPDVTSCIAERMPGEACSETQPCVADALCVADQCQAKATNSTTCTDPNECAGGFCIKGTNDTEGLCGAVLTLSPTTAGSCSIFLPSM